MTCILISMLFLAFISASHPCLYVYNTISAAGLHQQLTDDDICFTARRAAYLAHQGGRQMLMPCRTCFEKSDLGV